MVGIGCGELGHGGVLSCTVLNLEYQAIASKASAAPLPSAAGKSVYLEL